MAQLLQWGGSWASIDSLAGTWNLTRETALLAQALGYYARELIGVDLYITSGGRTVSRQLALREAYQSGQPGVFRPARCSPHLLGIAFDASPTLGSSSISRDTWSRIGAIAQALGLRWGGTFSDWDPVHFDTGQHLSLIQRGEVSWCI